MYRNENLFQTTENYTNVWARESIEVVEIEPALGRKNFQLTRHTHTNW